MKIKAYLIKNKSLNTKKRKKEQNKSKISDIYVLPVSKSQMEPECINV